MKGRKAMFLSCRLREYYSTGVAQQRFRSPKSLRFAGHHPASRVPTMSQHKLHATAYSAHEFITFLNLKLPAYINTVWYGQSSVYVVLASRSLWSTPFHHSYSIAGPMHVFVRQRGNIGCEVCESVSLTPPPCDAPIE